MTTITQPKPLSQPIVLPGATRTHLLRFASDEALTRHLKTNPRVRVVAKTILPLHAPGEVVCLLAEYESEAARDKGQALADAEELAAKRAYVKANAERIAQRRREAKEGVI
jgi:dsRNA-specific ribonuclease